MTDVVARIGARVDAIGGKWMAQPVIAAGAALGFTGYPWRPSCEPATLRP